MKAVNEYTESFDKVEKSLDVLIGNEQSHYQLLYCLDFCLGKSRCLDYLLSRVAELF